jgi:hypothetical protein
MNKNLVQLYTVRKKYSMRWLKKVINFFGELSPRSSHFPPKSRGLDKALYLGTNDVTELPTANRNMAEVKGKPL